MSLAYVQKGHIPSQVNMGICTRQDELICPSCTVWLHLREMLSGVCFWLVFPVIVMECFFQRDLQVNAFHTSHADLLAAPWKPCTFFFLCANSIPLTDESSPAIDEDRSIDGSLKAAESGEQLHEVLVQHLILKGGDEAQGSGQDLWNSGKTLMLVSGLEHIAKHGCFRNRCRINERRCDCTGLATVIGIKYESPEKGDGGNPTLKVKSFVSDEYKELIELAARF
ncbi:hypothetical protein Gotur_025747 [Gossypium turneri]